PVHARQEGPGHRHAGASRQARRRQQCEEGPRSQFGQLQERRTAQGRLKVTCYLEVTSSWCFWAEPAWVELKQRYAGRVEFNWKIALMPPEAYPVSRNQCEWFYRRSGSIMRSPFMLNAAWFEP